MKKHISLLLLSAALSLPSAAQELHSAYFMQTSDIRHEMNPALLDHAYVSMPLLFGYVNIGTTGNIGLSDFIYKMEPSWQGYGVDGRKQTTFMHPSVSTSDFLDGLKDTNRFSFNLKMQLLGFGFKAFGGTNSIELNLKSNTSVAVPKSLFSFMKEAGAHSDYHISNLGLRTENYMELALGHSHRINDRWTVGGKIKFLLGLAYTDISADNLDIHLSDDYWQVKGNIKASFALMNTKFKTSDKVDPNNPSRHRLDEMDDFKAGLNGFGIGFDLGATYKVIDDLTLSASITDLGFISWKNAQQATSSGEWTFDGFDTDIYAGGQKTDDNKLDDQLESIGDDLEDLFTLYDDGTKKDTRALAATLHLGAEYTLPVYRNLRFGFLYTSRIAGAHSRHEGMLSANIRPVKWFEATLNGAVSSTGCSAGLLLDLHAKHFNIFFGMDRFLGKLSKQGIPVQHTNANVSLGIGFPL